MQTQLEDNSNYEPTIDDAYLRSPETCPHYMDHENLAYNSQIGKDR